MEFSKKSEKTAQSLDENSIDSLKGYGLLEQVVALTELPDSLIRGEVQELLTVQGVESSDMTLTDLREALLLYLESVDQSLREEGQILS